MATILNIETSTNVCSAAIAQDGILLDILENFDDRSHAALLTVYIDQLFENNKLNMSNIDAVSVSEGPGSYTGLRIGVSVAKGLCYAQNKPLIAVNTLNAMALMAIDNAINIPANALLCPMIDARRMEVYSELFNLKGEMIREVIAEVIDEASYLEILKEQPIYFFGNGAAKCEQLLKQNNAHFIDGIYPSARYMATLAENAYTKNDFKDVAYFEPFYLKDFVATKPKHKGF